MINHLSNNQIYVMYSRCVLCCCFTSTVKTMVMSGLSVNLTALFLSSPSRLPVIRAHTFVSNL